MQLSSKQFKNIEVLNHFEHPELTLIQMQQIKVVLAVNYSTIYFPSLQYFVLDRYQFQYVLIFHANDVKNVLIIMQKLHLLREKFHFYYSDPNAKRNKNKNFIKKIIKQIK